MQCIYSFAWLPFCNKSKLQSLSIQEGQPASLENKGSYIKLNFQLFTCRRKFTFRALEKEVGSSERYWLAATWYHFRAWEGTLLTPPQTWECLLTCRGDLFFGECWISSSSWRWWWGGRQHPWSSCFKAVRSYHPCKMVLSVNFSGLLLDGHVLSFIFLGVRLLVHRELCRTGAGVVREARRAPDGVRQLSSFALSSISCVVVQSLSRVWLFATPWTAAHQASLSFTISWSLLKLMSIELMMPSNHLILCRPLLLLPSIFPRISVFFSESVLRIRWPKYWSFSFSIRTSNEYSGLISFRMDWFDLLGVQGTLKSLL